MYLTHPRRLFSFLCSLLAILIIIWLAFLDGGTSPSTVRTLPLEVQQVLTATNASPRVVVTATATAIATAQGVAAVTSIHYIDASDDVSAYIDNGKLVSLQRGRSSWVWVAAPHACYYRSARANTSVNAFAQQYLSPVAREYTYPSANTLDWTFGGSSRGVLTFNVRTHLLLTAIIYAHTRVLESATFSYPASLPVPAIPTNICKNMSARPISHRASS
jgi:hypothetical protein